MDTKGTDGCKSPTSVVSSRMQIRRMFNNPIQVEVKYTLGDYYSALAEHAPQIFKDLGKSGPAWLIRMVVPPIACVAAVYSGKLKPQYRFTFSDEGICREANSSKIEKSWSEIVRVRTYDKLFMIELEKGAMPLPYRFLSAQQLETLRAAFQS